MDATTFTLPFWADLAAVAIGGIQGAAYASGFRETRIDLLGIGIIGIASGLGGGVLRDLALDVPVAALQDNWYIPVGIAAALIGMLLARTFKHLDTAVTILDALTIGLYGAIGVTKAINAGLPEVPAAFVGTIAAVGGGILRDILIGAPIAVLRVGSFYATAAAAGTIFVVVAHDLGLNLVAAAAVGAAITFVVRLLAVRFGWSLPEQRSLATRPIRVIRRR